MPEATGAIFFYLSCGECHLCKEKTVIRLARTARGYPLYDGKTQRRVYLPPEIIRYCDEEMRPVNGDGVPEWCPYKAIKASEVFKDD